MFSKLEVPNNKYHIMITESKITEIFCIEDDFCKEFEVEMANNTLRLPMTMFLRLVCFGECTALIA